jgi:hypothetical protein
MTNDLALLASMTNDLALLASMTNDLALRAGMTNDTETFVIGAQRHHQSAAKSFVITSHRPKEQA